MGGIVLIELLCGDSIKDAFNHFHIHSYCTYLGSRYQVWVLENDEDLDRLSNISDEDWNSDWGWWRYATGCNIDYYPTHTFTINGNELLCWYDEDELNDFVEGWSEEDTDKESLKNEFFDQKYSRLSMFLCDMYGASNESNVCAVSVGLARLNGITLSELFNNYEGWETE